MFLKDYLKFGKTHFKADTVTWNRQRNIGNAINLIVSHLGNLRLRQPDRAVIQAFVNKVSPDYRKSTI